MNITELAIKLLKFAADITDMYFLSLAVLKSASYFYTYFELFLLIVTTSIKLPGNFGLQQILILLLILT